MKDSIKKLSHIKINHNDRAILANVKSILHRNSNRLFQKLRLCIDAEDFCQFNSTMNSETKGAYLNGAALMYQLMTNPDFLKDCDNIYSDDYYLSNLKENDISLCLCQVSREIQQINNRPICTICNNPIF